MRLGICSAIVALSLLTACSGAGMNAASDNSSALQQAQSVNVDNVKASVTNANTALANAQTAISTIFTSSGTFNWDIFLGGVDFTTLGANTQTCLKNAFPTSNIAALILTAPSDIGTALKCVLDDVVTVAGIANTDLNTALSTLNAALAAAGAGSPEAAEIQAMIDEVQAAQTSYTVLLTTLASQLTIVTAMLQQLPVMVTSLIPIPILSMLGGMLVSDFVQPITAEIMAFQSQLEAL